MTATAIGAALMLGLIVLCFAGGAVAFACMAREDPANGIGSVICAVCAISIGLFIYDMLTDDSPTIALKRDEWACTRDSTVLVPMLVGNVTVMQPMTRCVEWRER